MQTALRFASLMLAAVLLSGCSKPPRAEFSSSEKTEDLIPNAQGWVKAAVLDCFGTPDELVAWEKMPVAYGGIAGTIESIQAGESGRTIAKVTFGEEIPENAPPATLIAWKSGTRAEGNQALDALEASDLKTLTLTFPSKLDPAPAAGDEFVLGFGHQLAEGRKVYMKNCMHCHGVSGDGAGPTARYLNPLPRDFRLGIFKFTSTRPTDKISREDLQRTIQDGIPGTYMPSFLLMDPDEMKAVVEYVRWLAMRGEFEDRLNNELQDYTETALKELAESNRLEYEAALKDDPKAEAPKSLEVLRQDAEKDFVTFAEEDLEFVYADAADLVAGPWENADDPANVVLPSAARTPDTPESRERGRLLYLSDKTKCYTCHGASGKGDGSAIEDFWPKPGSSETYALRGLHDAWGHPLPPRDLTRGQYRGGRRPIDVFRRMYVGIKGTPMPAFGGTGLTDAEIWDIVNYVLSIPYPASTASEVPRSSEEQARASVEKTETTATP